MRTGSLLVLISRPRPSPFLFLSLSLSSYLIIFHDLHYHYFTNFSNSYEVHQHFRDSSHALIMPDANFIQSFHIFSISIGHWTSSGSVSLLCPCHCACCAPSFSPAGLCAAVLFFFQSRTAPSLALAQTLCSIAGNPSPSIFSAPSGDTLTVHACTHIFMHTHPHRQTTYLNEQQH